MGKYSIISISRYDILKKIGKTLTSSLDTDQILQMIMDFIGEIYKPKNWSLLMIDHKTSELFFSIAVGEDANQLQGKRVPIGDGVAGWAAKYEKTVKVENVSTDPRFKKDFDRETGFSTESIIAVPLISKDRTLGIIELLNIHNTCFESEHIDLLESLADFAAIAIENAQYVRQINEKSIRDDTTNLYNARHMLDLIETEISRAKRNEESLSVVFLDLDHFKEVNDNYGHLIGSQLLREIAMILQNNLRPTDWAIRYGGDEFVFLLPGLDGEPALSITERVRTILNNTTFFSAQGLDITVTASFGIASYPEHGRTREGLLKAADNAMYRAKENGRDTIVTADPLPTRG